MSCCLNKELGKNVKYIDNGNIGLGILNRSKLHLNRFWKTTKPYFSNKGLNSNKIFLSENANNLFQDHTSIIRIKSNLDNVSDKSDF